MSLERAFVSLNPLLSAGCIDKMPTTRRNGQLPSCEPCRKSKLRCDHSAPVCGRCIRRSQQHLCTYHPAPLTRPALLSEPKRRVSKTNAQTNSDTWSQKKASVSTPGFLGHTSYSDVFTDNASGLSTVGFASPSDHVPVDTQRIQHGAQLLVLLKYLPLYRDVAIARFRIWKGWTLGWPLTNAILTSTQKMWDDAQIEESDENKRALLLSKRLFEKYTQPIEVHSDMSWEEFSSAIAGRWETIGLLFTFTGLAMLYVSSDSQMFRKHDWPESKSLSVTAAAVGDVCLQFCDSAGIINDVVCWLLVHHTSLLSTVYGDGGEYQNKIRESSSDPC